MERTNGEADRDGSGRSPRTQGDTSPELYPHSPEGVVTTAEALAARLKKKKEEIDGGTPKGTHWNKHFGKTLPSLVDLVYFKKSDTRRYQMTGVEFQNLLEGINNGGEGIGHPRFNKQLYHLLSKLGEAHLIKDKKLIGLLDPLSLTKAITVASTVERFDEQTLEQGTGLTRDAAAQAIQHGDAENQMKVQGLNPAALYQYYAALADQTIELGRKSSQINRLFVSKREIDTRAAVLAFQREVVTNRHLDPAEVARRFGIPLRVLLAALAGARKD